MRLSPDLNRLEAGLNRRRADSKASWLMFPSARTSPHKTVSFAASLHRVFVCFLFFLVYLSIFSFGLPFVVLIFLFAKYRHHFHHIPWHLMMFMYKSAVRHLSGEAKPSDYFFLLCLLAVAIVAHVFASRWAWNRRADRLNREAALPLPAPVAVPGSWPPPPASQKT